MKSYVEMRSCKALYSSETNSPHNDPKSVTLILMLLSFLSVSGILERLIIC